ncbi:MAG: prepilin-type N-terminal cleavage/methylation domain-containing protein [Patescibacteria group bacterium]|jgi:prepilin-type N-terminal cleavage/methylation domain-containing protein|nr:prepilin-type N-terminal cleavage/methylation domain-containing protein [Patescibacteria group bacterium]
MKKNNPQLTGFTLIEILVATAVFLTVISITTATFLTSLRTQRYLLASINGTANLAYALEVMGREIRMGKSFFAPTEDTLNFLNVDNDAIVYRLNSVTQQIERSIGGGPFKTLTSPDVRVLSLRFIISGAERQDGQQVKVTILLKVASYAGRRQIESNIQTTISSRQPET